MKQAKWLLLAAVGILVMLPGCRQLNRAPNTDVHTAASITEDIWSGPIMTGGKMPQTQLGDAYIYWQYDYFDENADLGPDGNGQYVNLCLVVKYVTYEPMYDAQLNIDQTEPDGKGEPGHYNFNDYLVTELPATTAYFVIPVADFEEISGWDCGEWVWILGHVAAGGETGMIGPNFHHPKGQAWWNDLHIQCNNPGTPPPPPPEYDTLDHTAFGGNISRNVNEPGRWFWYTHYIVGGNPVQVTLWAGQTIDAGTVDIWEDASNIYVKFTNAGDELDWLGIGEVHVELNDDSLDIPWSGPTHKWKDDKYAPIPGQFDYPETYDPWVGTCTIEVPKSWPDDTDLWVFSHCKLYYQVPLP